MNKKNEISHIPLNFFSNEKRLMVLRNKRNGSTEGKEDLCWSF